jgi:aromatic-L-amino-acid decarboxylase
LKKKVKEVALPSTALDPQSADEWSLMRQQGHRMLDDMFDYAQDIRERPVWQPIPEIVRSEFVEPIPYIETDIAEVHQQFMQSILPYSVGNTHPGFFGWVHGGGTAVGMLGEMLSAGLNANLGGRDQIPIVVEHQVVQWMRELFRFPITSTGLFVTGTSMANMIAVWVARNKALGPLVRSTGLSGTQSNQPSLPTKKLVGYTSAGAHGCIAQAMDLCGIGTDSLRVIAVDRQFQMDLKALEEAIHKDLEEGLTPFFIAGTAGTVDVGAIDDLTGIADIAARNDIWFHVDGAYGALGMLSQVVAPLLNGIERADSIAFDFHKWGQVPYDAGFILVRDGSMHHQTFASPAAYLRRESRGMAAGSPWPCDFGPDLSRGFRALKTWFTLKVFGGNRLGEVISETCRLAQYLASLIQDNPNLELLAPVRLNIVCFRYRHSDASLIDLFNSELVADLQESGVSAPSTTTINGKIAIRAAIVNHRTGNVEIEAMIAAILKLGAKRKEITKKKKQ